MAIKAAMWVHGTVIEVENPERLVSQFPPGRGGLARKGWGAELTGQGTNFVHIPIPTPVFLDDIRPALARVFVFWKTTGNQAIVTHLHVWDGPTRVKQFDEIALSGDHSTSPDADNTWEINPLITIKFGLGLSVGVQLTTPRDIGVGSFLVSTAGADFETP